MLNRCGWETANSNKINQKMIDYHDTEWGVPVHDDVKLFEFIILDAFQAGLNWSIILNKRENFRKAFDDFDFYKIATYDNLKIEKLLSNAGIIRNKLKINAAVENAKAFIEIRNKFGTFDKYFWQFTDGKTIPNAWNSISEIPPKSPLSDIISKDLHTRGFRFTGTTICYSFMQAAGMINDHIVTCFRYNELKK